MDLSQSTCFYHNDRVAVDKCEKCHKMICLQDKMTLRVPNIDRGDDVYTYCPICYNDVQQTSRKAGKIMLLLFFVFAIIIIGVFIVAVYFIMNMFNNLQSNNLTVFRELVFYLKRVFIGCVLL